MRKRLGFGVAVLVAVLLAVGGLAVVPVAGGGAGAATPTASPAAAARKGVKAKISRAVSCGRDGAKRVTSIKPKRPRVSMEKRWVRKGHSSQFVTLFLQLEGKNAVTHRWQILNDHSTRKKVHRKGLTRLKVKAFTGLSSQYAAFRVKGTISWRNPKTFNGDHLAVFTSAACSQPVSVPSWRSVSASGLPTTAKVLCAGNGTSCMAVGWVSNGVAPHATASRWLGAGWAQTDTTAAISVGGTSYASLFGGGDCTSSSFCLAVGRWVHTTGTTNGLAAQWNGGSWSRLPDPPMPSGANFAMLSDASCTSASYCATVGWYNPDGGSNQNNGGLIDVWDGSHWTFYNTGAPWGTAMNAIDCWAQSQCLAVGGSAGTSNGAAALRFAGATAPAVAVSGNSSDAALSDLSCTASTFCLAVGHRGSRAFAQRWNGSSLQSIAMPASMAAADTVSCTSASSCVIFGRSGAGTVVAQWNGRSVAMQSGTLGEAGAVEGSCWSTPAHCLAVSASGQRAWKR